MKIKCVSCCVPIFLFLTVNGLMGQIPNTNDCSKEVLIYFDVSASMERKLANGDQTGIQFILEFLKRILTNKDIIKEGDNIRLYKFVQSPVSFSEISGGQFTANETSISQVEKQIETWKSNPNQLIRYKEDNNYIALLDHAIRLVSQTRNREKRSNNFLIVFSDFIYDPSGKNKTILVRDHENRLPGLARELEDACIRNNFIPILIHGDTNLDITRLGVDALDINTLLGGSFAGREIVKNYGSLDEVVQTLKNEVAKNIKIGAAKFNVYPGKFGATVKLENPSCDSVYISKVEITGLINKNQKKRLSGGALTFERGKTSITIPPGAETTAEIEFPDFIINKANKDEYLKDRSFIIAYIIKTGNSTEWKDSIPILLQEDDLQDSVIVRFALINKWMILGLDSDNLRVEISKQGILNNINTADVTDISLIHNGETIGLDILSNSNDSIKISFLGKDNNFVKSVYFRVEKSIILNEMYNAEYKVNGKARNTEIKETEDLDNKIKIILALLTVLGLVSWKFWKSKVGELVSNSEMIKSLSVLFTAFTAFFGSVYAIKIAELWHSVLFGLCCSLVAGTIVLGFLLKWVYQLNPSDELDIITIRNNSQKAARRTLTISIIFGVLAFLLNFYKGI